MSLQTAKAGPKSIMATFQTLETPVRIEMHHFNKQRAETCLTSAIKYMKCSEVYCEK